MSLCQYIFYGGIMEIKRMSTRLPAPIIKKLKLYCAYREISMGSVIAKAIDKYLRDNETTIPQHRLENG